MPGFEIGRLDRLHYWALLSALCLSRVALHKLLGAGPAVAVTAVFIALVLTARFHDFGGPTGLAATLAVLVYGFVFGAIMVGAASGEVIAMDSPEAIMSMPAAYAMAILLPEPLMLLLAGTISGNATANAYGPAQQGFAGWLPRPVPARPAAPLVDAGRMHGRAGEPMDERLHAVGASGRRRTGAPSFGCR
jgi:hypothetical protein